VSSASDYSYEEAPLTITRLEVENVKRIKLVRVNPEGSMVVIGGANDQGKSSLTDAIRMLLGGERQVPETALRRGARHGHIIGQLGEELLVERTFSEGGKTSLRVTDLDGRPLPGGPQTILARLYNALSFDPVKFAQGGGKEQAKALQEALGLDFTDIDARRAKAVAERTGANRTVRDLEGRHRGAPFHLGAPKAPVSVAELALELDARLAKERAFDDLLRESQRANKAVDTSLETVAAEERAIGDLEAKLAFARDALATARDFLEKKRAEAKVAVDAVAGFDRSDPDEVRRQLKTVEETNQKVRENSVRGLLEEELSSAREEAARLEREIEDCDAEKAEALAAARFPVDGLSFRAEDGSLLLNGLPLEQAAESQRIRLSVAIGFALNPRLKVLLVRQGSELDSSAMRVLAELAEEHGGQVWIERVSEDGAGCSVVLEDGEIKAAAVAAE
jgi:hypothetical protein